MLVGIVVSNKMDKTAVVAVERRQPHPLYRKIVRQTTRYKAHDPNNQAVLGDVVRIVETRPISKEKRWRIAETMTRGNVADIAPRDIGIPDEPVPEAPAPAAAVPTASPEIVATPIGSVPVAPDEPEGPRATSATSGPPRRQEAPAEESTVPEEALVDTSAVGVVESTEESGDETQDPEIASGGETKEERA